MSNLEIVGNKKTLIKKSIIPAVAVIVFLSVGYGIGTSNAKTELNGEKRKFEEVAKEVKSAKEALKVYEDQAKQVHVEIVTLNSDYSKRKAEFDEALKASQQKNALTDESAKLSSEIETKKSEIANLDTTIQTKKNEVASLEQVIKEKKEAPIELPAGTFIVGKDLQPGRYKVVPVGRGSNFKVYNSGGTNLYSEIISSVPNHGVPEYIVFLSANDIIEARSPFKYVPVE